MTYHPRVGEWTMLQKLAAEYRAARELALRGDKLGHDLLTEARDAISEAAAAYILGCHEHVQPDPPSEHWADHGEQ